MKDTSTKDSSADEVGLKRPTRSPVEVAVRARPSYFQMGSISEPPVRRELDVPLSKQQNAGASPFNVKLGHLHFERFGAFWFKDKGNKRKAALRHATVH